jgi:hypothetical protein
VLTDSSRPHRRVQALRAVLVVLLLSALVSGGVAPATASARPRVALAISSAVNAGSPTSFTWTAQRVRGSLLAVQRAEGTAAAWRTVIRLGAGSSGSGVLPALPIGRYHLRLVEVAAHSRVLAAQVKTIEAFGNVSFAALFHEQGGVYATPLGTFPYALWHYNGEVNYTVMTVASNTCRSVHVEFIPGGSDDPAEELASQHGTLSVVQQSADPVSSTVPGDSKGTVDTQVIPGQSWAINVAQVDGNLLFTWFINGSAECFSTSLSH